MEEKYLKLFRTITLVASIVFICFVLLAWIRENSAQQWKDIQAQYREILLQRTGNNAERDAAQQFPIEVHELVLNDFNRVDRCISCHPGIENPRMADAPQPHTTHSGEYLLQHPPQQYGCTICHGGQGRALDLRQAFARDPGIYWPYPLLDRKYIQSACGKCHLALFSEKSVLDGIDVFQKGHRIFNREGCLGCHKAREVGGGIGPDLTEQGNKTKHEYNFQNIAGEQTISNWLRKHFIDPEMVSPGSQMLSINLPEEELDALVTFTMGLARPDIPFEYFSLETLGEFKGQRSELSGESCYSMCCSACHGKEGEGKDYRTYETGIPNLSNRDFLSVASRDFIRFTIRNGRGKRQMATWLPRFSGLRDSEISATADFIKGWQQSNSTLEEAKKVRGAIDDGREIFRSNCEMCHGADGRGGVALGLNKQDLLNVASNVYLFKTIQNGREDTAMPSWSYFANKEMADLLSYIRSWQTTPSRSRIEKLPAGQAKEGELLYHYLCSRCHGEFGEGGIGPAILNKNFLAAASDDFLRITIAKGRSHTPMFGWAKNFQGKERLGVQEISHLISFMRASTERQLSYIYPGATLGKAEEGRGLFQTYCAECHGTSGEGIRAPALNNQELLNAATNGYLLATISLGRAGTEMPSWGRGDETHPRLTGEQRQDIVAYLRSWQTVRIKAH